MKKAGIIKKFGVSNWILLAILSIYGISMLLLIAWGLSTSLKTRDDFYTNKVWLPSGAISTWGWSNIPYVLENFELDVITQQGAKLYVGIDYQLLYTILYAGGGALMAVSCSCIAGYMTSKFDYAFSKVVYTAVLVTMVIPVIGSAPAMVIFLKKLNIYDTYIGAYFMKFGFFNMYYLIIFATYKRISPEFAEAATIDGASELQIFVQIMVPMILPTLSTIYLIYFIEYWNDYQMALLYMPSHPTLAYGVYNMANSTKGGLSSPPMRMAGCIITAMPILILFIVFRNKIMGNVTMGGVKE